jgi:hypothetical protein
MTLMWVFVEFISLILFFVFFIWFCIKMQYADIRRADARKKALTWIGTWRVK